MKRKSHYRRRLIGAKYDSQVTFRTTDDFKQRLERFAREKYRDHEGAVMEDSFEKNYRQSGLVPPEALSLVTLVSDTENIFMRLEERFGQKITIGELPYLERLASTRNQINALYERVTNIQKAIETAKECLNLSQ